MTFFLILKIKPDWIEVSDSDRDLKKSDLLLIKSTLEEMAMVDSQMGLLSS